MSSLQISNSSCDSRFQIKVPNNVAFLFFSEKKSTCLLLNFYLILIVGWVSRTGFPDRFCQFTISHKILTYIYSTFTTIYEAMSCNFSYRFLVTKTLLLLLLEIPYSKFKIVIPSAKYRNP